MKPQFAIKLKFFYPGKHLQHLEGGRSHFHSDVFGKFIVETTFNMVKAPITASFKS